MGFYDYPAGPDAGGFQRAFTYWMKRLAMLLPVLLFVWPQLAQAQCSPYTGCPTPGTPPTPSVSPGTVFKPAYGGKVDFTVSVPNPLGFYGYTRWSTGAKTYGDSSQVDTLSQNNKGTGYYSYRAKTCFKQDDSCSGWSGFAKVYVVGAPQSPSVSIAAFEACDTSIGVSWSPRGGYPDASYTRSYRFQEKIGTGGWSTVFSSTADTGDTRTVPANPMQDTTYRYRVRARYTWNGHTSHWSGVTEKSVLVPRCEPDMPRELSVTGFDPVAGDYTLTWNSPQVGSWDSYELEEDAGSGWQFLGQTTAPDRNFPITGKLPATYYYRVRACNSTTCGPWSLTAEAEVIGTRVEVDYRYDALGRLVQVQQDSAVQTRYCYDDAGNRYEVVAGGAECGAEPPSEIVTGLSVGWRTGPSWEISWNPVVNADSYELELVNGTDLTVDGDTTTVYTQPGYNEDPDLFRPDWIRACFPDGHCGPYSFF